MNCTIPQNWSDEAMDYANRLADRINVGWDGENYCPSDWSLRFLVRLNKGLVKVPFTYEAFRDNDDIMATLEGYGLDAEKFWYALLFIYDITISFCLNAADASKTDYEILTELNDFLQKHPKAVLYLSEDRELRKSERYETNSPLILAACVVLSSRSWRNIQNRPNKKSLPSISFIGIIQNHCPQPSNRC